MPKVLIIGEPSSGTSAIIRTLKDAGVVVIADSNQIKEDINEEFVVIGDSAVSTTKIIEHLDKEKEQINIFDNLSDHMLIKLKPFGVVDEYDVIRDKEKGAYRKFAKKSRWQRD